MSEGHCTAAFDCQVSISSFNFDSLKECRVYCVLKCDLFISVSKHNAIMAYRQLEVNFHVLLGLMSAVDGGDWSASRPGCFTPGMSPQYPLNRGLDGALEPFWTVGVWSQLFSSFGNRYNGINVPLGVVHLKAICICVIGVHQVFVQLV
jgi:hypothetical protein